MELLPLRRSVLFFLCCFLFATGSAYSENSVLTVTEFQRIRPEQGEFIVRGFVVKRYECPECPEGAQCKPCMPNHIVLSDDSTVLTNYSERKGTLLVLVPNPQGFILKKKYRLALEVTPSEGTSPVVHIRHVLREKALE